MSGNCPSCGAPVKFLSANPVQTVCPYCRSVLLREGVSLDKIGQMSELPEDPSPIQIGTEGIYRQKPFAVVGRIIYEYDQGGWNEWSLSFSDGSAGWLSDAQLEYAVTFNSSAGANLPQRGTAKPGSTFTWKGVEYSVSTQTLARYSGVEGELPFRYWGKNAVWFLDLRTSDSRFATIDYSEEPPLLFLGEAVSFNDLHLKNLREFEGWKR